MPNVLIIDDDLRLRRQMENYLHEVDSEKTSVRSLGNVQEFEKLYLNPAMKKTLDVNPKLLANPLMIGLNNAMVTKLLAGKLAEAPIMSSTKIKIKYEITADQVLEILPTPDPKFQFAGMTIDVIKGQAKSLINTLVDFQKGEFERLKDEAVALGHAQGTLVWPTAEKQFWLVRVDFTYTGGKEMEIDFEESTAKIRPLLDKERIDQEKIRKEIEALQLYNTIDILIVKTTSIKGRVADWVVQTRKKMRDFELLSKDQPLRIIVTKYEDDLAKQAELNHPLIDDLIYLPLDRQLFMQKLDILLNFPKIVQPRFLFSQQADVQVELSKPSKADAISDVGIAIRNPIALRNGTLARFYFEIPGHKEPISMFGKVIRSIRHPEHNNQYLVYFSWFGATRAQITPLRQYLGKQSHYVSFVDDDAAHFVYDPESALLSADDRRQKTVVVIDPDEDVTNNLQSSLHKDMPHIRFHTANNFALFLKTQLNGSGASLADASPATEADLGGSDYKFILSQDNFDLVNVSPTPAPESLFLGHALYALSEKPSNWKSVFDAETLAAYLEEGLRFCLSGRSITQSWYAYHADGSPKSVQAKLSMTAQNQLCVEFVPRESAPVKDDPNKERIQSIELIVLNIDFINTPIGDWIDNIQNLLASKGMLHGDNKLKVLLIGETQRKVDLYTLHRPEVIGFIPKPIDNRQLLFLSAFALKDSFTMYRFDNIGWHNSILHVHLAKPARVTSISEFGVTLQLAKPVAPGSFLYIRQGIFQNAPGGALCMRFYNCEEDQASEETAYNCSALYFGITDAFLKFARSWIRETYAASKKSESA